MSSQRFSMLCRSAILAGATVAAVLGTAGNAMAQALKDVQTSDTPLVLKAQGSFFVGGDKVEQTQGELGDLGPGGHITVNQMYVRYMVPQGGDGNVPVVMVHGATLTGKSWETTPDGRMGWDEYFVRKGHPVYVPGPGGARAIGLQSGRLQQRARGLGAAGQPSRAGCDSATRVVWPNFRFGAKPGARISDSQFPVTAVDELAKQGVPDVSFGGVPTSQPDAQGVVGSRQPIEWRGVDGTLAIRIVSAGSGAAQSRRCKGSRARRAGSLSGRPTPTSRSRRWRRCRFSSSSVITATPRQESGRCPRGRSRFESCQALIGRLKEAGGQAQMLNPPERGIRGNSHMIMQDKNHLQIADLILQWIDERVSKQNAGKK